MTEGSVQIMTDPDSGGPKQKHRYRTDPTDPDKIHKSQHWLSGLALKNPPKKTHPKKTKKNT